MESVVGFGWLEYTVFFGLLGASALIGVYHGFSKSGEQTVEDYMLGGRNMPFLPVALSLAASFVSGITLLGIPAETYMYGTQMYNICFAISICYFFMSYFYLPVIYELQGNSLFEYLELRFNASVRNLTSFVYVLYTLLIVPVVIYVPALAFNQVTGMSIHILAPMICGICIFYTSLGGLKAVVWSDALQTGCVLFALLAVITLGLSRVGGLSNLMDINRKGERLEIFVMDPDPTARNTFWTTTFGSLPTWLMAFAANPSTAQRYISLRSYTLAKMSVLIMVIGIVVLKSLSTLCGLIIYARYHDCDPITTKDLDKPDKLLPHFIMEVSESYPGLAGLFMAGVVCTALSTMSTMLNTIAGTIYEDFLRARLPWEQTETAASRTIQLVTVVIGATTTALVFLVERAGTIMQVAVSLQGVVNGVILFVFTFGMFVPWGNSKGVKAGTLSGLLATSALVIGAQYYTQTGNITFGTKPLSIENCTGVDPSLFNSANLGYSGAGTKVFFSDNVPYIFRLSYLYYSLVGLTVGFVVGCVVSCATGYQNPRQLDRRLVIPQLRGLCRPDSQYLAVPDGKGQTKTCT